MVRWTTERVAELERLWAEDLIARQIAERLEVPVRSTTNRIARMGRQDSGTLPRREQAWTTAQTVELERMWSERMPVKEIAAHLGMSPSGLTGRIRKLRAQGADLPARCQPWTPQRIAELERLWAVGLAPAEIGERLGTTAAGIEAAVKVLRRRGTADLPKRVPRWTPARIAELERMWAEGMPVRGIGLYFGLAAVSVNSVIDDLRREGCDFPLRRKAWTPFRIAELEQLWTEGLTTAQIAAHMGVLPHIITAGVALLRGEQLADLPFRSERQWTDAERIAELERMWAHGLTIPKIAERLGVSAYSAEAAIRRARGWGADLPQRQAWPPEQVAQLEQLWADGATNREIAAAFGIAAGSVNAVARNLRGRGAHLPYRDRRRTWTPARIAELEGMWAEGLSVAEIAERLELSWRTVNHTVAKLRKEGAELPLRRDHRAWTPARIAALKDLWDAGITAAAIAEQLGVNRFSVDYTVRQLRKQGVDLTARWSTAGEWPAEKVAELERLWARGLSRDQIAERMGVTPGVLQAAVERLRVKCSAAIPGPSRHPEEPLSRLISATSTANAWTPWCASVSSTSTQGSWVPSGLKSFVSSG